MSLEDTRRALQALAQEVIACERCPRLRQYCMQIAREKVRRFRDWEYWGRPVPGFGDPAAKILVIGLAPAAHGGNRTGRMFTGDSSGDWLIRALYEQGFANQPFSSHRDDGLELRGVYITAIVRCAPPNNRPTREEIENCSPYLLAELEILRDVKVVIALGRIAFENYLRRVVRSRAGYAFRHGAAYRLPNGVHLIASYHPSRQNTQTGRLTWAAWSGIFRLARELASRP